MPPPRRTSGERRQPSEPTVVELRGRSGAAGRGGIGDARRYAPRGRTVRESRDPFRPALELVNTEPLKTGSAKTGSAKTGSAKTGAAKAGSAKTGSARTAPARPRTKVKKAAPALAKVLRKTQTLAPPRRRKPPRRPPRPPQLATPVRRLRLGTVLILVAFLVIGGRLVTLQLTDARTYALQGLKDRLTRETLFAPRGAIYDRDHNVLAQSLEARYVFADPSHIKPAEVTATANALRDLLGIPLSELIPKLTHKYRADGTKDEFEYLARGVSVADGDAVQDRALPGIGVGRDEVRSEPGNDLAANLIGYTGYDGAGLTGLEYGYDKTLAGQDGSRTFEVGNGSLVQIPGGYDEVKPARPGSSVELTVNRDLQYKVQQILSEQMSKANATFAAAVVLDAHTGEVYAQASYPTYNAADPSGSTVAQRLDAATQITVDPGSIHKVITLGAALDSHAVTPDTWVSICPTIRKADQTYQDDHPFRCGTQISLPGILAFSSNVGTITVASHLAPQTLYDFQRSFGLGAPTGEGLPGEASGLVQPPKNWSGTSYGSIPIGMGVSVTPLQMAAVYAAIANDGVYTQPRLIKSTIAPDGTVHPATVPAGHRVLTSSTAAILRSDLEAVVTVPGATGTSAAVTGYRVAGKTGTGKYVQNGVYAPGNVASFIGMAPADAPRFVIAVVAYAPHGGGGQVSAPAFSQMMQFALRLYHVPPTGTSPPKFPLTK